MQTSSTQAARRRPVLVIVQSAQRHRWEVAVEHRETSQFFTDRDLALSYAQIWASVNRPSMVRVYGTSGTVEHEWAFG
jgi:hypothetical protein